jgi:hypothetical protein
LLRKKNSRSEHREKKGELDESLRHITRETPLHEELLYHGSGAMIAPSEIVWTVGLIRREDGRRRGNETDRHPKS